MLSPKKDKHVRFDSSPHVHTLYTWLFASNDARKGTVWRRCAVDRMRFQMRIKYTAMVIEHVLSPTHRQKIFERLQNSEI